MPGKPRRHKVYGSLIARARDPQEAQTSQTSKSRSAQMPAGSNADETISTTHMVLTGAIAIGLLRRLRRLNSDSAKAALQVISHCRKHFPKWEASLGTDAARAIVTDFITYLPNRYAEMAENPPPDPIRLLQENIKLLDELKAIPRAKMLAKREKWLSQQGVGSDCAHYPDGQLAEWILHKRHGLGPSTIHKLLAQAGRDLKKRPSS